MFYCVSLAHFTDELVQQQQFYAYLQHLERFSGLKLWIRNISGTCLLNNIPYFIRCRHFCCCCCCGDGCFSFAISNGFTIVTIEKNGTRIRWSHNFDICTGFSYLLKSAPNEKHNSKIYGKRKTAIPIAIQHTHTPTPWQNEEKNILFY